MRVFEVDDFVDVEMDCGVVDVWIVGVESEFFWDYGFGVEFEMDVFLEVIGFELDWFF